MSHKDSPEGRQYHIRYSSHFEKDRVYWSHIISTCEDAVRELRFFRKSVDPAAKLFVRDVSPWREDDADAETA